MGQSITVSLATVRGLQLRCNRGAATGMAVWPAFVRGPMQFVWNSPADRDRPGFSQAWSLPRPLPLPRISSKRYCVWKEAPIIYAHSARTISRPRAPGHGAPPPSPGWATPRPRVLPGRGVAPVGGGEALARCDAAGVGDGWADPGQGHLSRGGGGAEGAGHHSQAQPVRAGRTGGKGRPSSPPWCGGENGPWMPRATKRCRTTFLGDLRDRLSLSAAENGGRGVLEPSPNDCPLP